MIRTYDLQLRRVSLYPSEVWAPEEGAGLFFEPGRGPASFREGIRAAGTSVDLAEGQPVQLQENPAAYALPRSPLQLQPPVILRKPLFEGGRGQGAGDPVTLGEVAAHFAEAVPRSFVLHSLGADLFAQVVGEVDHRADDGRVGVAGHHAGHE